MDSYIYMPKEGKQYAIVPSIYEKKCFNGTADGPTNEEEDLLSIYPDFSQFKKQSGYYEINGHGCEKWQWINTVMETTHEYNMYFDNVTGMPVRYHMNGYNNIQGSHYDEYILDYHSYKTCIFLFIKIRFNSRISISSTSWYNMWSISRTRCIKKTNYESCINIKTYYTTKIYCII